jgi:simple sugar transport system permease protein
VLVLQGIAFVLILASEALRGVDWKARLSFFSRVAASGQAPQSAGGQPS